MELEQVLKQYFGYDSFRPGQKEVIEQLVRGKDTIALLPTGMGKSLCYQLPGYLFNLPVLIISPLLSLMQDQVEQLKRFGEKRVVAINSFLNKEQKFQVLRYLDRFRFIFISPEMLMQETVKQRISQMELSLLVVDEAHCISQWGFDFRPDYLKIGEVVTKNRPPILALSATATKQVLHDIRSYLKMEEPYEYLHSVDRANIHIAKKLFHTKEEKLDWLVEHVMKTAGPGIIYTRSRNKCDEISERLLQLGLTVSSYHGGKDGEDRQFIQQQFIEGNLEWIVATNAFGMGVHKDNVRQVIHETMPSNVSDYMQEIGRAGRDGKDAVATLLYSERDEEYAKFIASEDLPNETQIDLYKEYSERRENPKSLLNDGLISETSFRVLHYWMNQYPAEQVKTIFRQMLLKKEQQVHEMTNFVKSDRCLREQLVAYFGQTLEKRPTHCCENCGLDEELIFKPREIRENTSKIVGWEGRIRQILIEI